VIKNYHGKFLSSKKLLSEDRLVLTQIMEWSSAEHFLEFIADDVCIENLIEPTQKFNSEYNIISETTFEEIN
jgi:hypothetical protein